jgi:hypothetical protein
MIPQADDIIKIMDIPLAVANGAFTLSGVSKRYSFDKRQALYYFEAAEMLGLVVKTRARYSLSPLGKRYLAFENPQRKRMLILRILSLEVCTVILGELIASPIHSLSYIDVEGIVAAHAHLSRTTIRRRAHTLLNWFRWIGQETRAFKVDGDKLSLNLVH